VILLIVTNWGNLLGCSELPLLEYNFIGVRICYKNIQLSCADEGEESTHTHLSTYSALSFTLF
jgi:hypothetical protein